MFVTENFVSIINLFVLRDLPTVSHRVLLDFYYSFWLETEHVNETDLHKIIEGYKLYLNQLARTKVQRKCSSFPYTAIVRKKLFFKSYDTIL